MGFNKKQLNNLQIGTKMVIELIPSDPKLRKFLTVFGYEYDENKKFKKASKYLKPNKLDNMFFQVWCYEVLNDERIYGYDITDDLIYEDNCFSDIKGIKELEKQIERYTDKFYLFKPEWESEHPFWM